MMHASLILTYLICIWKTDPQGFDSIDVMVYDHNWDDTEYPISILDDDTAKQYVSGTAFHCYGGDSGITILVNT